MTRRMLAVLLAALAVAVSSLASGGDTAQPREPGCRGQTVAVDVSRSKYPAIVAHIRYAQSHGQPRLMRINRSGASERRARLLSWWQARHPQPSGDHLDLDEQAPAMARSSWRADVRPVPEGQNRSQGASMGGQLRGVPDGACFRWRFVP
jgi:hypothetical protein